MPAALQFSPCFAIFLSKAFIGLYWLHNPKGHHCGIIWITEKWFQTTCKTLAYLLPLWRGLAASLLPSLLSRGAGTRPPALP